MKSFMSIFAVAVPAALMANALVCFGAAAQTDYKFDNIDCAQSRVIPLAGMTCRATNVVTGGSTTGGMFKRWSVAGTTSDAYTHYFIWEGLDMRSHIRIVETLPEYLQWANARAQAGSQFGATTRYKDVDYTTFRGKEGRPCAGFRRLGDSRGAGYAYVMGGIKCWTNEREVTPAQITQFIDEGRLR